MRWRLSHAVKLLSFLTIAMLLSSCSATDVDTPSPSPSQVSLPEPSPDPSVAGELTAESMPTKLLDFEPTASEATEGEFNANGTFVHAVDPASSSWEALPQCGELPEDIPEARYALAGTYTNANGSPGNTLLLDFADADHARDWFKIFTAAVQACDVVAMEPQISDDSVADQRLSGESIWTEAGIVKDESVLLAIVLGKNHDAVALLNDLRNA